SAGLRSTPSVLLVPLEESFGWSRATTSFSAAIGIFLYGLVGPFAAAAMERFGLRRVLIGALALMAASTFASSFMTEPWHLLLTWGVFSGIGSGAVAVVTGGNRGQPLVRHAPRPDDGPADRQHGHRHPAVPARPG